MKIYRIDRETAAGEEEYQSQFNLESELWNCIENKFEDWIESSNPAGEYEQKYFSEDAIYDKRGAIQGAIEGIYEYLEEENIPCIDSEDHRLDIECFFE
jgi:hypothetical protein